MHMNSAFQILDLKESILADNDADAALLREELRKDQTYYLNVMSSPGSGKTSSILALLHRLPKDIQAGVMEADIDSDVDAKIISAAGFPAIQLHTGGMCHLDADMSRQGLRALGSETLDLVILENVGNLVCPAEFETGAVKNLVILSVPEGHDKPLKYPLMFQKADVVLINKMDTLEVFDFDLEKCKFYIAQRNPAAVVFPVSAETGEGFEAVAEWLTREVREWRQEGGYRHGTDEDH